MVQRYPAVFLSDEFYPDNLGDYQRTTVSFYGTTHISSFLSLIRSNQSALGIATQSDIKPHTYEVPSQSKILEGIDWYNMPAYGPNPEWNNVKYIYLFTSKTNRLAKQFKKRLAEKGINIRATTSSFWYPERPIEKLSPNIDDIWVGPKLTPKYPIYVISKGRWEKRLTSRYLEWAGIPYKIVVEKQEYDKYAEVISKDKILILPDSYQKKNAGSIPVRNFVLDHSKKAGHKRHWVLDDNIRGYARNYHDERKLCKSGAVFRAVEDYTDRYTNVMLSGHNYSMFSFGVDTKPVILNSRVYSSILVNNDIPFRWRGRYNEDTDLSLRVLKAGFCTIQFNAFTSNKLMTLSQKGGNTDTIYSVKNALYLKAKSLADQHPDVAKVTKRFGRIHHQVNYNSFKKSNKLIMKEGLLSKLPRRINNYGLRISKNQSENIFKDKKEVETDAEEKDKLKGGQIGCGLMNFYNLLTEHDLPLCYD